MKISSVIIILVLIILAVNALFIGFKTVTSVEEETYQELAPVNKINDSAHLARFNITYRGADMEPRAGGGTLRVDYYDIENLEAQVICLGYTTRLNYKGEPICGSIGKEQVCLRAPMTKLRLWLTQCESNIKGSPLNPDYRVEPFFSDIPIIEYEIKETQYLVVNKTRNITISEPLWKNIVKKLL
jgi:hypothetical protein